MGFIPLPLGALVLRVVSSSIPIVGFWGFTCFFMVYLCLMSAKVGISIALLGKACDEIEMHRIAQKEKLPQPRQCNSLPSSRHHSTEDLPKLMQTKSMPQSQCVSASSSIADITAKAEILQETLEPNLLFHNSTVSLNSMGMDDNVFGSDHQFPPPPPARLKEYEPSPSKAEQPPPGTPRWKATATFGDVTRSSPAETEPIKRRSSLQETVEFVADDHPKS